MPALNENSKTRSRYLAIIFAFVVTCLAHAAMIFIATRILRDAGVITWTLEWRDASALGVIAVVWRMWLRQRP